MNLRIALLLLLAAPVAALLIAATTTDHHKQRTERTWQYIADVRTGLLASLDAFDVAIDQAQRLQQFDKLRSAYEDLRLQWKLLEPLAGYCDPAQVTTRINAAPLQRVVAKSQYIDINEAAGLQVIDQLVYDTDSALALNSESLKPLATELRTSINEILLVMTNTRWTSRMQLEACRSGILRITALGLSGFDRPLSEPRAADETAALETIGYVLEGFRPQLAERNRAGLMDTARAYIAKAVSMMQDAAGFDRVDRADLIRFALDPLYGLVVEIQGALEIEFAEEALAIEPALNGHARSMFASNTINPYTWSGIRAKSVTDTLVALGRSLFFDPILSSNGQRACASCHLPERAFTDGHVKSVAIDHEGTVRRNAPTLINAVLSRKFFHDLRAERLSEVVEHVVTDPREFGFSLIGMVGRLRASPAYVQWFDGIFEEQGPAAVTNTNVNLAIAAYLGTLVSFDSPVDRYLRGENVTLDPAVRRGFNLFMGRAACGTCHFAPTFSGFVPPTFMESESEVLGVPMRADTANATLDPDLGRFAGALLDAASPFRHAFKTPTIRNAKLTAPYMHNGAYPTLRDVVKFYDLGGGLGIGIPIDNQTLAADRLDFSDADYSDLIAFMEALTDTTGLLNKPTSLPLADGVPAHRKIGGEY